jgi:diacylglycerol kinase (ATP)
MLKIALIYNELSGRKFRYRKLTKFRNMLLNHGTLQEYRFSNPGDLLGKKNVLKNDFDLLVIAGGDGTVNGVLNLIYPSVTPLLVLPFGSGNDIAAAFGHKVSVNKIDKAVSNIKQRSIDVIEIKQSKSIYCLTVTCVATDGLVSKRASTMSRYLSSSRYLIAAVREIITNRPVSLEVKAGDSKWEGLFSVCSIANTPTYGGGLRISPKSESSDRQLELVLVERLHRSKLILLFLLLLKGWHVKSRNVSITSQNLVDISSTVENFEIWGDGQYLAKLPTQICLASQPMRILVI